MPAGTLPHGTGAWRVLTEHGWDVARLRAHAAARRDHGEPWPHPLPPGWVAVGQWARVQAATQQLVAELAASSVPPPSGPLDRRDRELLADRPPHW